MCHALIAEHMFTPNLDTYTGDDAIIDTFTRKDSARATRARASTTDKLAFDRKKVEWKRHLATVRSTLSEIFLWFIREVSTAEIQQDFEQVFSSHILQNQTGTGPTNPFNGDILIHHIESNYVTDNSDSITAMERKFETMVRWRSETIVQWIDRFEAPLAELCGTGWSGSLPRK
jgi:hypothetical protein